MSAKMSLSSLASFNMEDYKKIELLKRQKEDVLQLKKEMQISAEKMGYEVEKLDAFVEALDSYVTAIEGSMLFPPDKDSGEQDNPANFRILNK
jgi:hypothetical protein